MENLDIIATILKSLCEDSTSYAKVNDILKEQGLMFDGTAVVKIPKLKENNIIIDTSKYNNPLYRIVAQDPPFYICTNLETAEIAIYEHNNTAIKLWTIDDARAGDILTCEETCPFIYNGYHNDKRVGAIGGLISYDKTFELATTQCNWCCLQGVRPATNKERELLFATMAESHYAYDAVQMRVFHTPRFKIGNCLVKKDNSGKPIVITDMTQSKYNIESYDGKVCEVSSNAIDNDYRLWTINDAKPGDILYFKSPLSGYEYIMIFKNLTTGDSQGGVNSYGRWSTASGFKPDIPNICYADSPELRPANNEQRKRLFKSMHEAGYFWNETKLKCEDKIERTINRQVRKKCDELSKKRIIWEPEQWGAYKEGLKDALKIQ